MITSRQTTTTTTATMTPIRTTASRNFNKRRMTSTILTAILLTVASTTAFQPAHASSINRPELMSRQEHDIFENFDGMVKRVYDTPSESVQSKFLAQALSLAGTYSPTVSTIAGLSTSSSNTKKTSSTTSSSAIKNVVSTSSSSKKTSTTSSSTKATSTSKGSSADFPQVKTTVTSSKSASATAVTLTKATSTQTHAVKTKTWSWAAGPYGCGTATPSGKALLCYATGAVTSPSSKRALETTLPFEAREIEEGNEEYVRRSTLNASSIISAIDNLDSPDLGWLDTIVGAVPYKSGDFASSIIWIIATLMLLPLFLIRLARQSTSIAHVLVSVFLWISLVVTTFGLRAYMANTLPTTTYMIVENVILQILPNLLLEPLLTLLAMYSVQGGVSSGVPSVCLLLRLVNFIAFVLFAVSAAFTSVYMHQWNQALLIPTTLGSRDAFPTYLPPLITRLGPIIGSFMMLGAIAGGLLLIPVARGKSGSLRPGAFLGFLFLLVTVSVVYRVLQSLHASNILSHERSGEKDPFSEALINNGATTIASALMQLADKTLVQLSDVAPPGMYNSEQLGIAWDQLQETMSSRGVPQTPVMFNLMFILPMWLQVFLLFFVHAPSQDKGTKLEEETATDKSSA